MTAATARGLSIMRPLAPNSRSKGLRRMVNASGGDTRPLDGKWMFAILFAVSMSAALINGFPFLHYDSVGYAGVDMGWGGRSLTPNFFARLLFPLFGIWSLPVINAVVFSILSILLLGPYLPRAGFGLYLGAVIASFAPLYIGYVMADAWGLYLVLATLISLKSKSPLVFLILSVSITTHGGHFVLFPLLAVGVVVLFRDRLANLLFLFGALAASILIALTVSLVMNPSGGTYEVRWSHLGNRLFGMHTEVLHRYCEQRRDAVFCIHRDLLLSKMTAPDTLIWDKEVMDKIDRPAFEDGSYDFALFTLTEIPIQVAHGTLRSAAEMLLARNCILEIPSNELVVKFLTKPGHPPGWKQQFDRSLQAAGRLSDRRLCRATGYYVFALYGVVLVALILAVVAGARRGRLFGFNNRAILFLLFAILANALVYAFLAVPVWRYHYKLLFLFFLILLLVFEAMRPERRSD